MTALGPHLRAHPYDILAARAALRSPEAGPEEPLRLAALVLDDRHDGGAGPARPDATLLRLRVARGLLPAAAGRAAQRALGPIDAPGLVRDLARRRMTRAQIDEALADVARIATRAGDAEPGRAQPWPC